MRWINLKNRFFNSIATTTNTDLSNLIQDGLSHHNAGELQEAKAIYEKVLNDQPNHADALHLLGVLTYQLGQFKKALTLINKAIKINSADSIYFNNRGLVLQELGLHKEAAETFQHALTLSPTDARVFNNLGNTLQKLGRSEEAINSYKKAIANESGYAEAYNNLGNVYQELGQHEEAINAYKKAISIKPNYIDACNILGTLLHAENRFFEAINCFKQALNFNPENVEAHNNLGNAYMELGMQKKAISNYMKAINIDPEYTVAYKNLGVAYQELGQKEQAVKFYNKAIMLNSGFSEVHHYLTIVDTDNVKAPMLEELLSNSSITNKDEMHYHYALGNVYQSSKSYDLAFKHFQIANSINRGTINYDSSINSEYINSLIKVFSKQFFNENKYYGSGSDIPVFIIGMPRSGTSLVEQIISNHPMVYGAGEITTLAKIENEITDLYEDSISYPESITACDESVLKSLSENYLREINNYTDGVLRITDKLPGNFLRIGLVKLIFPNARIIHCRRNALDTCISIYTNYFAQGYKYAYDQEELGKYYLDYVKLMSHWNNLFSKEIFEVHYEELVNNQEMISRQLLEYLGLDWDDHCINFYENIRPVKTASNMQVRKPIYHSAIDRWRIYEKHILPLIEIINSNIE